MNDTAAVRRHRCPVCLKDVEPTQHGNIALHFDSINRDQCPANGEPFAIAEPYFAETPAIGRQQPTRELPPWHRRRPALRVVA